MVYYRSGTTLRISCTVNLEPIKTVYKETTELQLTIGLTAAYRWTAQSSLNQNLYSALLIRGDLLLSPSNRKFI